MNLNYIKYFFNSYLIVSLLKQFKTYNMKTVEIQTLFFITHEEASKTKNYPNSGLFISNVENGINDLRWVDKNMEDAYCIVPSEVFYSVMPKKENIIELPLNTQKYDGAFILEFSRILLNRK